MSASRTRLALQLGSLLVAAIVSWHVTATYTALSHTADEPLHVAGGLEWFQEGTHSLQAENPPLAEIAHGLGAHLAGHRLPPAGAAFRRGTEILYSGGSYLENLVRARLGTLPFFLLAIAMVWWWARQLSGERAAFLATAAFCTLPPILGHAGLATTDVPFLAVFLWCLHAWVRWLAAPSLPRAGLLGLALGLGVATKFSTLVFFPPCALAIAAVRWALVRREQGASEGTGWRERFVGAVSALLVGSVALWAVYGFSVGRVADNPRTTRVVERCFPGDGLARRVVGRATRITVPAPDLFFGMLLLGVHTREGNDSYLLGEERQHGFRSFYLVGLGVKTPLSFMLLAGLGLWPLLRRPRASGWERLAPAAAALALLATAIPSSINIGLRHVFGIYPLLAIAAGLGVDDLLRRAWGRRRFALGAAVGLMLLWQLGLVVRVRPDYIGWFNALAGREPGRILVNSDLDWGQDLFQLRDLLAERDDVDLLHIAYFGSARLCEHGLPPVRWLQPRERVTGWVAISEMYFRDHWHLNYAEACDRRRAQQAVPGGYLWLREYEPVAIAGRSIRVYHIPE